MTDTDDYKLNVYQQLCTTYHAIDDIRTKLLGLLPLATGGGIFLLVGDEKKIETICALLVTYWAFWICCHTCTILF